MASLQESRKFVPPRHVIELCRARETELSATEPARETQCQRWLLQLEGSEEVINVPNDLWVAYRIWVDVHVALREGRPDVFHNFLVAQTLGISTPRKVMWNATEAADLLSCLAAAGLLLKGLPSGDALEAYLQDSVVLYNNRFTLAKHRAYEGYTREEEGKWEGAYDFVQLADPQIGMFKQDVDWLEETTMLRLAVQHVNRLKPKFLLVSGDMTNVWPSPASEELLQAQTSTFKEVLRELDPSIPVVLQPGNHDVGQNPGTRDVERYCKTWGDDYFKFWVGGVLYLSINSQFYHTACNNFEADALCKEQEEWIKAELDAGATLGSKHVVLLSHIAPFMGEEDEPQGHFNWAVEPRKWLLGLAAKAGVKLWLSGHYHGNCHVRSEAGIDVVTTSSCGGVINWNGEPSVIATNAVFDFMKCVNMPPVLCDAFHSGLRIFRVSETDIEHKWFELAYVPQTLDDCFAEEAHGKASQRRRDRLESFQEMLGLPMQLDRSVSMPVPMNKRNSIDGCPVS
eukprot:gene15872-18822_t